MANGQLIIQPSNGATTWERFPERVYRTERGMMQISLTEMETSAISVLESGSCVEIGGGVFTFADDLAAATGATAIVTATTAYMKFVPASTECTWEFTAVAPTWDSDKQGWYGTSGNATHRYFGTVYKSGTSSYEHTILYSPNASDKTGNVQFIQDGGFKLADDVWIPIRIEIGAWNMLSTASLEIAHSVSPGEVRDARVTVRRDDNTISYPLDYNDGSPWGYFRVESSTVWMGRTPGEGFNADAFTSSAANRGWITIWYDPT